MINLLSPVVILTTFLIFVRVSTILLSAPFFGSETFNTRIKLFFAISVTIIIMPGVSLEGTNLPLDISLIQLLIYAIKEMAIGFALGLVGQLIFGGVQLGGQFISMQVGLSFANIIDPTTQTQNPIFSQILALFGILIFLAIGGDHIYIQALNKSFDIIPLGMAHPDKVGMPFVKMTSDLFIIGLQMSSPFIVVLFLLDLSFAIFARMMPQANIFFVAMPLKVGAGIVMLVIVMPRLTIAFEQYFSKMWQHMADIMALLAG